MMLLMTIGDLLALSQAADPDHCSRSAQSRVPVTFHLQLTILTQNLGHGSRSTMPSI